MPFDRGEPLSQRTERMLVLDANEGRRSELRAHLVKRGFPALTTASIDEAFSEARRRPFFLALIGQHLPGVDGLEVLSEMRRSAPQTGLVLTAPRIGVDLAVAALRAGAFDVLSQPFTFESVLSLIDRLHEKQFLDWRDQHVLRLQEREKVQDHLHTQFMISLARIIDAKSKFTKEHSERVGKISRSLAAEYGFDESQLDLVDVGGKLHDIGKIGTPESILNKQGPLTADEFLQVQDHPLIGAELIKPITFMAPYTAMIRNHHENYDGRRGYPDGLQGDEIPIEAQIVKLADYYDAITSRRPYREPMKPLAAFACIEEERGKAFRPDLVDALGSYLRRRAHKAGKSFMLENVDVHLRVPTTTRA
jgi:putative nucleotidyltransferase with HDIG domain